MDIGEWGLGGGNEWVLQIMKLDIAALLGFNKDLDADCLI